MTSVTSLLETPFLTRDPTQQFQILELGRPLPSLELAGVEIVEGNNIIHPFNVEIYGRNIWICGCDESQAFFCFPCLLYGGDDVWSTSGFNNIVHLENSVSKHELSPVHMSNILNWTKSTKKPKVKPFYSVEEQNKRNEKNLQLLEAVVDCMKFCAFNAIPISKFTEDYEEDPVEQLLLFTTSGNTSLKDYLQKEPFNHLESMKTDILNAASEVIREEIIEEIQRAEFVSLIVKCGDDNYPKIIILRYIKGCEPIERIWKIIHYENMDLFFEVLLAELCNHIKNPSALISQSYDQLTMKTKDGLIKLHSKVQHYFPQAHLVYFYSHDFLDVISHVATIQKHYQEFYCMVCGICEFMANETWSSKLKITFEDIRKRFYKEGKMKENLDFSNNRIETVFQFRRALIEMMSTITANCQEYPDPVISQASYFMSMLENEDNIYMLEAFYKMVPFFDQCIFDYENCLNPTYYFDSDTICSIIDGTENQQEKLNSQTKLHINAEEIVVKIEDDFEIHDFDLANVKLELPETETEEEFSCLPSTSKRMFDEDVVKEESTAKAVRAVKSVMIQLEELLKYRTNMFASQLVDPRNFNEFSKKFPDHLVSTAIGNLHFFSALDSMKLRTELGVLYARSENQSLLSSCDLLEEILENNLATTFSETVKLLRIVLTIPSISNDPKRCFKTKSKVEHFLRESRGFKNIESLVYFRCERTLIENIDGFNNKVIKKFLEISEDSAYFQRLPSQ